MLPRRAVLTKFSSNGRTIVPAWWSFESFPKNLKAAFKRCDGSAVISMTPSTNTCFGSLTSPKRMDLEVVHFRLFFDCFLLNLQCGLETRMVQKNSKRMRHHSLQPSSFWPQFS